MPSRKGPSTNSNLSLTDDDNRPLNDASMADYANHFFTTIGSNLANLININNSRYLDQLKQSNSPHTLRDFPEITLSEVKKLVQDIKISKSANIKDINSKLLKEAFESLIPHLVYLFNLICVTTDIPNSWKLASVTPIFKEGNNAKICFYRPISLLPLPVKLFEKLIHKRMYDFIEANNLLFNEQGGSGQPWVLMTQFAKFSLLFKIPLTLIWTPFAYILIFKKLLTQ